MMSAVLAVLFFISARSAVLSYDQYNGCRITMDNMMVRSQVMNQQIEETKQKKKTVSLVNSFVSKAVDLGLEEKNWSFYKVNIKGPVTFEKMEQLLSQCSNSPAYYFHPITFHVKTIVQPKTETQLRSEKKLTPTPGSPEKDTPQEDVMLTLTGAFVIQH